MAYCKTVYKYSLNTFYKRINKKKYELQILEANIYYTNIILMQNIILITKVLVRSTKKKSLILSYLMKRLYEFIIQ